MFKIKRFLLLSGIFIFLPTGAWANQTEETLPANLIIDRDTVWSGRKILNGSQVRVENGAVLTLTPGTTLIGNNGAMLYVLGRLVALGEENKKIRFTSNPLIKQASSLSFFIESGVKSEIELKNFILERGGGNQGSASLPAMAIRGSALIDKSIIKRNKITAIRNWGSNLVIKRSDFYENENLTLENKSAIEIKAEENWWGEDGGPNQSGSGAAAKVTGVVDCKPWENKGPMPIIFLPGIGGSLSFQLLNENFHNYWFLTPFGTGAYRNFVKNLIISGYQYEENFFWGFYDWRLRNQESARLYLKKIIEEVKTKNKHYEVRLVAHSMGGLMARSYIQSDFFGDDVDRLVTLGTPHLGSSDIYAIWEGEEFPEENEAVELYIWFLGALNPEMNQSSIIRKEFLSIGEMLPIYDYLIDRKNGNLIKYADQKNANSFLEDLKNNSVLTAERTTIDFMAGTGEATLESIPIDIEQSGKENWREGKPDPLPPQKDIIKGDGRVTEKSALAGGELAGISTLQSSHADLPEKALDKIFNQMRIKPKNPWVTTSLDYLIFGLSGLVNIVFEDEFGRILSLSKKEIPESFFEDSGAVKGKKLAYAEIPLEENRESQKIKIKFLGQSEEKIDFALWAVSAREKSKTEFEKYLAPGVELALEVDLRRKSDGKIETAVISEKYSNTISFLRPKPNEKFLNWQKLKPEISFFQLENVFKNEKKDFWLDGRKISEDTLDLSKLGLGKRKVILKRVVGDQTLDEAEVEFEVESSIKSLITILNCDFKNGFLKNESNRAVWINDLALSYQLLSNGELAFARNKLSDLTEKIAASDGEQIEERNRILANLESIIKNPN